ncbi:MAG TPA: peptidoglycan-associated lipoprotein Pal [Methylomirabilota bacterium]|nr:peptidoglycan-associated lipoprotein Pal [Methylomirabilota bacterium]
MKTVKTLRFLVLAVLLITVVSGCKRRNPAITPLPGRPVAVGMDRTGPGPVNPGIGVNPGLGANPDEGLGTRAIPQNPDGTIPQSDRPDGWIPNRERFASQTVYYDYDRSNIKAGEASKVDAVAEYLKSEPNNRIEIEGHCDERGTEEYNRALGERRALAVRELLVSKGIPAERISTVSFGENKPAVEGQDESSWAKNRRAEFILLTPPQQ